MIKTVRWYSLIASVRIEEVSSSPVLHGVDHDLLCMHKYYGVKCEDIDPTAKAWLRVGHVTGH